MWTHVTELEVRCPTPYPAARCYGDTEWLGAIFNPRGVLFQTILNDEMLKLCLWEWINNNKTVYTFPNREWVQAKTRGWDVDSEPMERYLCQNI